MKAFFTFLILFSFKFALACTPGGSGGPTGDPNCMGGVFTEERLRQQNRGSGYTTPKINRIQLPDYWGAVSASKTKPYLDSVDNMGSEKSAKELALERCEKASASSCELIYVYKNGCASVANGSFKKNSVNIAFPGGGDTPRMAESDAIKRCEESGGQNCRIVMPTECSLPTVPKN